MQGNAELTHPWSEEITSGRTLFTYSDEHQLRLYDSERQLLPSSTKKHAPPHGKSTLSQRLKWIPLYSNFEHV